MLLNRISLSGFKLIVFTFGLKLVGIGMVKQMFGNAKAYPYIYMGQCPAKSPLWYLFKFSRTSKRKVTLALKCMANYKFSA